MPFCHPLSPGFVIIVKSRLRFELIISHAGPICDYSCAHCDSSLEGDHLSQKELDSIRVERLYSGVGSWTVWVTASAGGVKSVRSLVDGSPKAKSETLCFRVEAKSNAGAIIHRYQTSCVPPYNRKEDKSEKTR